MKLNEIYHGDSLTVLKTFEANSIDLIITSPPFYKLRDYKVKGQIGQEETPQEYITNLMAIMDECKRVLKKTGSLWVNLGDSYNKNKSLMGIPEKFVEAMELCEWTRRNTIIWHKPNVMPSSVKDRFTVDFEYFYFYTKSPRKYYFKTQYRPLAQSTLKEFEKYYTGQGIKDYEGNGVQNPSDVKRRIIKKFAPIGGIKQLDNGNKTYSGNEFVPNTEEGSIKRCVWTITTKGFKDLHFAVFPQSLIETPIKACCPAKTGIVLDPFFGAGTVGVVAKKLGVNYIGIELNKEYVTMAQNRINSIASPPPPSLLVSGHLNLSAIS